MSKDKQTKDPAVQGKQIKTAADLIQDEHNYRKHSDTNKARIKKSIDEAGLGRSVVIDADGVLVAGNGVQQVVDKDTPVKVVETDGTELVVVKRTDLHTGDPRRKTLALADNATADDVEWDFEAIAEDWTEDEVGEWGVEWPEDEEQGEKEMEEEFKRRMADGEDLLEDEEYLEWLEKHQSKKTTDDCYTPPEVFDCVRDFATSLIDMDGRQIVRPFYPHGDFENYKYPDNCVVIDNPPFSIITKIVRWYEERGIKYFLFAPHLTCFGVRASCTILTDANIKYENGAVVKTSFVTNFIDDPKVWGCVELKEQLNNICNLHEHSTERKIYPRNATNSALFGRYLSRGIEFKIPKDECVYIGNLDEMKDAGMRIFGGGILFSDRVADELDNKNEGFERVVHLSERENEIVKALSIIGKRKDLSNGNEE